MTRFAPAACVAYTRDAAADILAGGDAALEALNVLLRVVVADGWPGFPGSVSWWAVPAEGSVPGVVLHARGAWA